MNLIKIIVFDWSAVDTVQDTDNDTGRGRERVRERGIGTQLVSLSDCPPLLRPQWRGTLFALGAMPDRVINGRSLISISFALPAHQFGRQQLLQVIK